MMFQGETPAKYKDDPVTRPLAFPEPLLPGVTLNDFWVTMEMAEITQVHAPPCACIVFF